MKKIFLILLLVIAIIGVVFISIKKFSGSKAPEKIRSFETIGLRISGMRLTREYEIINKGEKTEILLFHMNYKTGEEKRILEKTAEIETEEFIEFLNFCNFGTWNGFEGKHPKNVSDGEIFDLKAVINGGETLEANGSANFPKGYSDFIKELDRLLNGGE